MFSLLACRKLVSTSQAGVSGNLGAKCLQHWSLSACHIEVSSESFSPDSQHLPRLRERCPQRGQQPTHFLKEGVQGRVGIVRDGLEAMLCRHPHQGAAED